MGTMINRMVSFLLRFWKMRFLRRRAFVCDAKLGGLGPAAAAEGGSMARRQFLVFRCCFFLSPWTSMEKEEKEATMIGR